MQYTIQYGQLYCNIKKLYCIVEYDLFSCVYQIFACFSEFFCHGWSIYHNFTFIFFSLDHIIQFINVSNSSNHMITSQCSRHTHSHHDHTHSQTPQTNLTHIIATPSDKRSKTHLFLFTLTDWHQFANAGRSLVAPRNKQDYTIGINCFFSGERFSPQIVGAVGQLLGGWAAGPGVLLKWRLLQHRQHQQLMPLLLYYWFGYGRLGRCDARCSFSTPTRPRPAPLKTMQVKK